MVLGTLEGVECELTVYQAGPKRAHIPHTTADGPPLGSATDSEAAIAVPAIQCSALFREKYDRSISQLFNMA